MHLLEAAFAWIVADGSDKWWVLAEELVTLCERYLTDPGSGSVIEYFASDWSPLGGRDAAVIELVISMSGLFFSRNGISFAAILLAHAVWIYYAS